MDPKPPRSRTARLRSRAQAVDDELDHARATRLEARKQGDAAAYAIADRAVEAAHAKRHATIAAMARETSVGQVASAFAISVKSVRRIIRAAELPPAPLPPP